MCRARLRGSEYGSNRLKVSSRRGRRRREARPAEATGSPPCTAVCLMCQRFVQHGSILNR